MQTKPQKQSGNTISINITSIAIVLMILHLFFHKEWALVGWNWLIGTTYTITAIMGILVSIFLKSIIVNQLTNYKMEYVDTLSPLSRRKFNIFPFVFFIYGVANGLIYTPAVIAFCALVVSPLCRYHVRKLGEYISSIKPTK